jgi:soluble lytic murein transglycosylase-like protein
MASSGHRGLIFLGVTAVLAAATCAGGEVRTVADRARCGKCARTGASYQQVALTPTVPRAARRPAPHDHGAYSREIAEASARYAVPERLIRAVIRVESGFDHRAVSPKGARGLMQLMPETAAILGVRDPFDPRQNIHGGTRHLRAMLERFRQDVRLALAAYNAGERPVVQHGGVPPYPETRQYVAQVLRFYKAPIERVELRADGVRRIVRPDGTVVYTNIAFGGFSARSR